MLWRVACSLRCLAVSGVKGKSSRLEYKRNVVKEVKKRNR